MRQKSPLILFWQLMWGLASLPGVLWVAACVLIGLGPRRAREFLREAGVI